MHNWRTRLLTFMTLLMGFPAASVIAQPYAYVANAGSNTIALINTETYALSGSVTVPGGPGGIAVTPDGSTVYVTSVNFGVVTAVDAVSRSAVATIRAGLMPMQLAVSPNGALIYVINQSSNDISVIENTSKTVTTTISVGSHPSGLAFSPDGTRAYVTNLWSNTISVIDTATNAVIDTFPTASGPNGVAVTPDGQQIYAVSGNAACVTVHDRSGKVLATIGGFLYPVSIAITPDGSRAFVVDETRGAVSVIDTGSNSVAATISVGLVPTSVAISTDGTQAFVTNEFGFSLSVLSISGAAVVKTVPGIGVYPIAVATVAGIDSGARSNDPTPVPVTIVYFANGCYGAQVNGISNQKTNWAISPETGGLTVQRSFTGLNPGGTPDEFDVACFSPPPSGTVDVVTLTATSVADSRLSGSITVNGRTGTPN